MILKSGAAVQEDVVGGVVIGTAAYFAGEFVYQHWGDITHGIESAGKPAGQQALE